MEAETLFGLPRRLGTKLLVTTSNRGEHSDSIVISCGPMCGRRARMENIQTHSFKNEKSAAQYLSSYVVVLLRQSSAPKQM